MATVRGAVGDAESHIVPAGARIVAGSLPRTRQPLLARALPLMSVGGTVAGIGIVVATSPSLSPILQLAIGELTRGLIAAQQSLRRIGHRAERVDGAEIRAGCDVDKHSGETGLRGRELRCDDASHNQERAELGVARDGLGAAASPDLPVLSRVRRPDDHQHDGRGERAAEHERGWPERHADADQQQDGVAGEVARIMWRAPDRRRVRQRSGEPQRDGVAATDQNSGGGRQPRESPKMIAPTPPALAARRT